MRPAIIPAVLLSLALPSALAAAPFKRGDSNADGNFDISDAVKTLGVLFLGEVKAGCDDAMDSNDDGSLDITDGIYALAFLFTGGRAPPAPYPGCGEDPTPADPHPCASYPHCAPVECLDQSDIDQAITENIPSQICVPPDAAQLPIATFVVTVCPSADAVPCGGAGPGCTVDLQVIEGTLDIPGRKITVHAEGHMEDFPVEVADATGTNPPIDCTFDVDFEGDLSVAFTAAEEGGALRLTAILDPVVEGVTLDVTASPGFICAVIASQKAQFIDALEDQLLVAAEPVIEELRAEYVGDPFCP